MSKAVSRRPRYEQLFFTAKERNLLQTSSFSIFIYLGIQSCDRTLHSDMKAVVK